MDFHRRKLLSIRKIDLYYKNQVLEVKKDVSCEVLCKQKCPDDCKGASEKLKCLDECEKNDSDKLSCLDKCKNSSDINESFKPPPPPLAQSASHQFSSILIVVFCILAAASLFVMAYLWITRYRSGVRNHRRGNPQPVIEDREDFIDENQGPVLDHPIWYIRTVGLQQSVIDSIEVFRYRKGEGLIEGTDCSVCLSGFEEDENLRLLPKCSHAFHIQCIDTWLRSHKNCPLCRAPIVNDANVAAANVGHQNLLDSASREDNQAESIDNHAVVRSDEVGENGTPEMRLPGEGTVSSPIEEENDFEDFLEENSFNGSARKNKARVKSDVADHSMKVEQELEVLRRSISIDSHSASCVYYTMLNNYPVADAESSNVNLVQKMKQNSEMVLLSGNRNSSIYSLMKSSSLCRSLQKMPISMKRSFSSTGKSSLPTHSRNQDLYRTQ